MKNSLIFISIIIFFLTVTGYAQTCATPGKEDPATVSGVVNTYFPAPSSATASGKNIPVGAVINPESSLTPIVSGDLLLIIQMQDATISTSNDSNYGAGTGTGSGFNGGSAGYYEYTVATNSVSTGGGTVITVSNLSRSYYSDSNITATRGKQTYQVVRIPQYSTVTVSGTLQAAKWDGTSGGIVAMDVAGNLSLTGTITAASRGFRGGQGRSATSGSGSNSDYRVPSSNLSGASKGEGIVGTPRYIFDGSLAIDTLTEGYPSGSYDRGAPGNAGGGGTDGNPTTNDQNSGGGGGGGNGGSGGQGGNSWSSNLTVGGVGGAAFPQAINRLAMGGGGGAGTTNNGSETTSSGGNGGGMVFVRTGSISGTGTISADGANAQDSNPNCCGDGAGGGGAGGSIIVLSSNTSGMSGIKATAKGGKGGNTLVATANHGPGGGGGGGVILSNASLSSATITAGSNGTTTSSSVAYGAASGVDGTSNSSMSLTSVPGISSGAQCVPSLTVTKINFNADFN